jgi:hypothetical protein
LVTGFDNCGQMIPLRVPHNQTDTGDGCESFGIPLGIASHDDNARSGIFPMQAPDSLTYLLIGAVSNSAGIHDHNVGIFGAFTFRH